MPNPLKPNPLSPQRKKQRIDELAARAGSTSTGTAVEDRAVSEAGAVDDSAGVSLIASAWRRLRRDPIFLIGAAVTLLFIVLAIFSPLIAPHDPTVGLLLDKVRPQSNPIPARRPASRSARTAAAATCSRACWSAAARPSSSASSPPSSASSAA